MQIFISNSLISARLSWLSRIESDITFTTATRYFIEGQMFLGMTSGTAEQGGYTIHWKKLG